ncbi:hypothetical protein Tco_0015086 [Tanacetum coccineum]
MAPRGRPTRTTRARPVTATPPPVTTTPPPVTDPTTTTSVTNAQLQAMIDEGVTAVLAARATTRNGDDSHTSGTGVRRNERTIRECTYQDFMKCQPLFFKGTEGCQLDRPVKKIQLKYSPEELKSRRLCRVGNLKYKAPMWVAYNLNDFQELGIQSDRMFPEELTKLKDSLLGMPDLNIKQRKFEARLLDIKTKPTTKTKGRTQQAMLPGTVTGDRMRGLNLDVPSVTSTITVLVHHHALTARKKSLDTWPRT